MPPLAELQARLRDAVVLGESAAVSALLVGGRNPLARLEVHRRHYETSLVESILRRFPGTVWLLGEPFLRGVAQDYVRSTPPVAPCIAEYAEDFPDCLQARHEVEDTPYAASFARLEWLLGQAACAVDERPIGMGELAEFGVDLIPDLVLSLQPGTAYLEAPWPVDDLAKLHLSESAPDEFEIKPGTTRLQVHGSRGSFTINRLDTGTFAFRKALSGSRSIGEAAEHALACDDTFDPGNALTRLIAEGLVIAAHNQNRDRT